MCACVFVCARVRVRVCVRDNISVFACVPAHVLTLQGAFIDADDVLEIANDMSRDMAKANRGSRMRHNHRFTLVQSQKSCGKHYEVKGGAVYTNVRVRSCLSACASTYTQEGRRVRAWTPVAAAVIRDTMMVPSAMVKTHTKRPKCVAGTLSP